MSNQDKIYFSKQEYNKLMQIINDNLKCKDNDIRYRATRLKEKFDNYVYFLYLKTERNEVISSYEKKSAINKTYFYALIYNFL